MTFLCWPTVFGSLLIAGLPAALSCSTTSFDTAYADYPSCAKACLACPDPDYTANFENNCHYSSGDCCKSQSHESILATWGCVKQNCNSTAAEDAFKKFVKHCSDFGVPLAAADVPPGYNSTTSSSGNDSSKSNKGGSGLSNEKIAAIAAVLGVVVASISAWIAWRTYKKRHARQEQPQDDESGSQLQVLNGTHLRPLGIPLQAFSGGVPPDVMYSRKTTVNVLSTAGVSVTTQRTTEKLSITRNDESFSSSQSPRGRIVGELDY